MILQELKKVINHNNWRIAMTDLADIHELLTKLGNKVGYTWFDINAAVEKDPYMDKTIEKVFISKNIDWNLISNLKVLDISEDFTVLVGYTKFHS